MEYVRAFLLGGLLCALGQILIDRTALTPAKILTGYVTAGVLLSAFGLYQPLADWGGAGATVPLTGFGHLLARGCGKRWRSRACWAPSPAASPQPPEASRRRSSSGLWWPRCLRVSRRGERGATQRSPPTACYAGRL